MEPIMAMSDANAATGNGYRVSDLIPRDGQRKFKTYSRLLVHASYVFC